MFLKELFLVLANEKFTKMFIHGWCHTISFTILNKKTLNKNILHWFYWKMATFDWKDYECDSWMRSTRGLKIIHKCNYLCYINVNGFVCQSFFVMRDAVLLQNCMSFKTVEMAVWLICKLKWYLGQIKKIKKTFSHPGLILCTLQLIIWRVGSNLIYNEIEAGGSGLSKEFKTGLISW